MPRRPTVWPARPSASSRKRSRRPIASSTGRRDEVWRSRLPRRIGVNGAILAAAAQNLTQREAQLAEHLAKIDDDVRRLDHEKRLVSRERETLQEGESRLRAREEGLRQREDAHKRRLNDELDLRVREARQEIDAIVADLKRRTAELASRASAPAASTGDAGMARADARAALDDAVARLKDAATPPPPAIPAGQVATVGDRVAVDGLNLEGRRAERARRRG